MQPYVGVTGFTASKEVSHILGHMPPLTRKLMVGVLANHNVIQAQEDWKMLEEIHQEKPRYPIDPIANLFRSDPRVFNVIHYNAKLFEGLGTQLNAAVRAGGANIHGIQLNACWPPVAELWHATHNSPHIDVILQIGARAMEEMGNDPRRIARRVVNDYGNTISGVLLDASGGRGIVLDVTFLADCLWALEECSLNWKLAPGIAGGLSYETLRVLLPLLERFPDVSIDAEGQLRNEHNRLEGCRVLAYLHVAQSMGL